MTILRPGYLRWDGLKFVTDPTVAIIGPAGPPGSPGVPGTPGDSGPTGAAGSIGATGPAGTVGATGPIGATGVAGITGPIGPTGAIGATGAIGSTGIRGATGTIGATGTVGATGAIGATGPAGGGGGIPAIVTGDEGKILNVVAGAATWGSITNRRNNNIAKRVVGLECMERPGDVITTLLSASDLVDMDKVILHRSGNSASGSVAAGVYIAVVDSANSNNPITLYNITTGSSVGSFPSTSIGSSGWDTIKYVGSATPASNNNDVSTKTNNYIFIGKASTGVYGVINLTTGAFFSTYDSGSPSSFIRPLVDSGYHYVYHPTTGKVDVNRSNSTGIINTISGFPTGLNHLITDVGFNKITAAGSSTFDLLFADFTNGRLVDIKLSATAFGTTTNYPLTLTGVTAMKPKTLYFDGQLIWAAGIVSNTSYLVAYDINSLNTSSNIPVISYTLYSNPSALQCDLAFDGNFMWFTNAAATTSDVGIVQLIIDGNNTLSFPHTINSVYFGLGAPTRIINIPVVNSSTISGNNIFILHSGSGTPTVSVIRPNPLGF